MQRFRGGLVFKAHRLLCHSTLGLRVIKNKEEDVKNEGCFRVVNGHSGRAPADDGVAGGSGNYSPVPALPARRGDASSLPRIGGGEEGLPVQGLVEIQDTHRPRVLP